MGGKGSGVRNKYTPEVHREIVKRIRGGAHKQHAAAECHVSKRALLHWLELGEQGVEPYVRFYTDVQAAIAYDAGKLQKIIAKAAIKNWKAAAWLLERKCPKVFGHLARQAASGDGGGGDGESPSPADQDRPVSPWKKPHLVDGAATAAKGT